MVMVLHIFGGLFRKLYRLPLQSISTQTVTALLSLLPFFLVPYLLYYASTSLRHAYYILFSVPPVLACLLQRFPRFKFFRNWALVTMIVVFRQFAFDLDKEYNVLPYRAHILTLLLATKVILCFTVWYADADDYTLLSVSSKDVVAESCMSEDASPNGAEVAPLCDATGPPKIKFYSPWLGCNIGSTNDGLYFIGLVLLLASMVFTPRTVIMYMCKDRPYQTFFSDEALALHFVCSCYCLLIAVYTVWLFFWFVFRSK